MVFGTGLAQVILVVMIVVLTGCSDRTTDDDYDNDCEYDLPARAPLEKGSGRLGGAPKYRRLKGDVRPTRS